MINPGHETSLSLNRYCKITHGILDRSAQSFILHHNITNFIIFKFTKYVIQSNGETPLQVKYNDRQATYFNILKRNINQ